MNRSWITLVAIGLIAVVAVVGWDVVLTLTGNKTNFAYNIVPINSSLYGKVEDHLKSDPNYFTFEQAANPTATDQTSTTDTTGTTPATTTPTTTTP